MASCSRRRCSRRAGPSYPLIVGNVLNYGSYLVQFSVQIDTAATVPRVAWLDSTKVLLGSPVTIFLDDGFTRDAGPASAVQTLTTAVGAPVAAVSPLAFQVYSAPTGVTALYGWDVDGSTLLYSDPAVAHPAPTAQNFLLTPTPPSTYLQTGNGNVVISAAGSARALRAIRTIEAGIYTLAWLPLASNDGYAVTAITLYDARACVDCYNPL
jgi:hypothetical protein